MSQKKNRTQKKPKSEIKLAEERFQRNEIISRLNELAKIEAGILSCLHPQPRMHS